jgi:hypothetical protein
MAETIPQRPKMTDKKTARVSKLPQSLSSAELRAYGARITAEAPPAMRPAQPPAAPGWVPWALPHYH